MLALNFKRVNCSHTLINIQAGKVHGSLIRADSFLHYWSCFLHGRIASMHGKHSLVAASQVHLVCQ